MSKPLSRELVKLSWHGYHMIAKKSAHLKRIDFNHSLKLPLRKTSYLCNFQTVITIVFTKHQVPGHIYLNWNLRYHRNALELKCQLEISDSNHVLNNLHGKSNLHLSFKRGVIPCSVFPVKDQSCVWSPYQLVVRLAFSTTSKFAPNDFVDTRKMCAVRKRKTTCI